MPTDSTLIRQVLKVVGNAGKVTDCVPSLGVLASSVVKVFPPSVEREIFTFAQLTGAAVVLATSQVMVCAEPPVHITLVLGDVI